MVAIVWKCNYFAYRPSSEWWAWCVLADTVYPLLVKKAGYNQACKQARVQTREPLPLKPMGEGHTKSKMGAISGCTKWTRPYAHIYLGSVKLLRSITSKKLWFCQGFCTNSWGLRTMMIGILLHFVVSTIFFVCVVAIYIFSICKTVVTLRTMMYVRLKSFDVFRNFLPNLPNLAKKLTFYIRYLKLSWKCSK